MFIKYIKHIVCRNSHLKIPASPDLLAVTAGPDSDMIEKPPPKVWSKTARFMDTEKEESSELRRRKEPPAVRSNEHLEAVESCL